MSEIPENVKEAARAAADAQGDYWKVGGTLETIERAILAEREACAKIAEVTPIQYWEDKRIEIAKAIRRR